MAKAKCTECGCEDLATCIRNRGDCYVTCATCKQCQHQMMISNTSVLAKDDECEEVERGWEPVDA